MGIAVLQSGRIHLSGFLARLAGAPAGIALAWVRSSHDQWNHEAPRPANRDSRAIQMSHHSMDSRAVRAAFGSARAKTLATPAMRERGKSRFFTTIGWSNYSKAG